MKDEYSILLAPSAWSQLGRVDANAYAEISRALSGLAEQVGAQTPSGRNVLQVRAFAVTYEVDVAAQRLIVHSVVPTP